MSIPGLPTYGHNRSMPEQSLRWLLPADQGKTQRPFVAPSPSQLCPANSKQNH